MNESDGESIVNGSGPKLVSKAQVASMLNVSQRTVDREVASGRLVKIKIRGAVRFRLTDVLKLVGEGIGA